VPIDPDVRDRLLATPSGERLKGFKRPELTLEELRIEQGGPHLSDEHLFRLIFTPQEDVDLTAAAGPLRTDYHFEEGPETLIRRALETKRARSIRVRSGDVSVQISRG
jgi:hypothetical protein